MTSNMGLLHLVLAIFSFSENNFVYRIFIIRRNGMKDKGSPKDSDLFVEGFARGIAVICAFGPESPALTLSQVAERAKVTPASARRLLHTLVALDYARIDGRLFSLTPAVLEIGYSYLSSLSIREIATPLLDRFAAEYGEIGTVSVMDRTDVVYVARSELRSPYSRRLVIGERLPAHATSSGHVLLGHMPGPERKKFFADCSFERFTPYTLTRPRELQEAAEQARADGYAIASEHLELGICGLAVPLQDRSGAIVGAVTTSLNLAKHSLESIVPVFLPRLQELARQISDGLTR
ncbi:IclR family transcriptional regulator domain-containing protein [Candidimonas humi]|uniref:IclR family transcriptional regulator C-terminal domain-containing protein n=1 Tax=Candidimonas humi TaxID=683355 RepID=A0ABV8NUB8_9BURK